MRIDAKQVESYTTRRTWYIQRHPYRIMVGMGMLVATLTTTIMVLCGIVPNKAGAVGWLAGCITMGIVNFFVSRTTH